MIEQSVVVEEWPAEMAPPPPPTPKMLVDPYLGLSLQNVVTSTDGSSLKSDGVIVTNVAQDSAAIYGGIQVGDVIAKVLEEDVSQPAQVFADLRKAREAGRKNISMLIRRAGKAQWTTLPL
jgi:S1-C subfamily serine protease